MKNHRISRATLPLASVLITLVITLMMSGCANAESEYDTTHSAGFFYQQVATKTALSSALQSPAGIFCLIYADAAKYYFCSSHGLTDEDNITAQTGTRPYNAVDGFVVGRLQTPDVRGEDLYAFDSACPNCCAAPEYVVRRLAFVGKGNPRLRCERCKRVYDPCSAGSVVEGAEGIKMLRYHISFDGVNNLQIYN